MPVQRLRETVIPETTVPRSASAVIRLARERTKYPRASKYHAVRSNGYASKREAQRGFELELLEREGEIKNLRKQVSFVLLPPAPEWGFSRPLRYVADFVYDGPNGIGEIVEDVKGMKTDVYKIKHRLMRQLLGVQITEI